MRLLIIAVPFFLAAPAMAAQPQRDEPTQPAAPILPQVLTDPAMADQLGRVAGAVTRSVMNIPVGELEAAIEGRRATRADRDRTVGDSIGDPYIEQRIAGDAERTGRAMQAAGKALAASLPAIMGALDEAKGEIERAIGNFPDPTYPRR